MTKACSKQELGISAPPFQTFMQKRFRSQSALSQKSNAKKLSANMKTTLDLRSLPDAELKDAVNAAVAVHCAGLHHVGAGYSIVAPPYATSADAVLPLLEKYHIAVASRVSKQWVVEIHEENGEPNSEEYDMINIGEATAPTFPLAACLALLRAHGVELLLGEKTK